MEAFFGNWKVDTSKTTGVAEMGKVFGWDDAKSQQLAGLQYVITIEACGGGFKGIVDYGVKKTEFTFNTGEPFDWEGPDGTQAKCTVTLEGGAWVERFAVPDKPEAAWTTTRSLAGDVMSICTTFDNIPGIKCCQTLNKV